MLVLFLILVLNIPLLIILKLINVNNIGNGNLNERTSTLKLFLSILSYIIYFIIFYFIIINNNLSLKDLGIFIPSDISLDMFLEKYNDFLVYAYLSYFIFLIIFVGSGLVFYLIKGSKIFDSQYIEKHKDEFQFDFNKPKESYYISLSEKLLYVILSFIQVIYIVIFLFSIFYFYINSIFDVNIILNLVTIYILNLIIGHNNKIFKINIFLMVGLFIIIINVNSVIILILLLLYFNLLNISIFSYNKIIDAYYDNHFKDDKSK